MDNYLHEVREQYENYSYPPIDLSKEATQLRVTRLDLLFQVNKICHGGTKDFYNNYRVLVAGGGTGDAVIFLAEQLKETNAEIIYVDISTASMNIAKKRADIRKLTNITWINESLLNLPAMDIGKFDYINCSGVLMALQDPQAGLDALRSVLKDDGAIGVMVYAQYGRTAIYPIQDALKIINKGERDIHKRLSNCKTIINNLPATNWLHFCVKELGAEIQSGDAAIYDLFLHSQDRAWTVPELYDFVEASNLGIVSFLSVSDQYDQYDPLIYLPKGEIAEKVRGFPVREQQALAELLCGKIAMHKFYVMKQ